MIGLLGIGTISILLMSVAALLASIGDWRIHRQSESLGTPPVRRTPMTVIVFHTDIASTLRSVAALHAITSHRLQIIVVDNGKLGSNAYAFRQGLRRLYRHPVRLYAPRRRCSRRDALWAAQRYLPARQQLIVIDGGDVLTNALLDTIPRRSLQLTHHSVYSWYRQAPLGPSFSETAEALSHSARQFFFRMRAGVRTPSSARVPAGSIYPDKRSLAASLPLQPISLTPLTTSTTGLPRSLAGQSILLAALLSWIAIFGHVAYLAASLQTVQPLLLCGLLSLFAVSILALWDQTTRLLDKLQLLGAAPLSALLVPVSLLCLTGASIVKSINWSSLRFWQLLPWARRKHS